MFDSMLDLINQTVSFSGYRNEKLKIATNDPAILYSLKRPIKETLHRLYQQGFRRFITGGALGFDTVAAMEVLKLRDSYKDVQLIVAAPFRGQERKYRSTEQMTYLNILALADQVHYISPDYHSRVYLDRNKYMLLHSSTLVCFYDGQQGGTMYTVNRAIKMGLNIINICGDYQIVDPDPQKRLF